MFEKLETVSTSVVELTVTAVETQPGALIWLVEPSFPAAMAVMTPAPSSASIAGLVGLLSQVPE